ncbi:MAG: hypothetical protein LIP04_06535 [Tannerellaceae bacterium]|nr:hypothetical protein [Tannerellaceae bacterium]
MKTVEIIEEARKEGIESNDVDQDCILYYNNSKGAATEYPQREQRLKALTDYILR